MQGNEGRRPRMNAVTKHLRFHGFSNVCGRLRTDVNDSLAGAPGFEPGNGGIKIRCLTTWLRPNEAREWPRWRYGSRGARDHTGGTGTDQCPAVFGGDGKPRRRVGLPRACRMRKL